MLTLLWLPTVALPLVMLIVREWRAFDGSVRMLHGLLLFGLPRSLFVSLVLSVLYLTWR